MSQAFQSTIYMGSDTGWTTDKIAMGVSDLDLLGTPAFTVVQGKSGIREETKCRAALTGEQVKGGFSLYPTDTELDWLLKYAFGTSSSSPWVPATAMNPFYLWAKKGGVQTYKYDLLYINQMTISGSEGQFLKVRCDLVGQKETEVSDLTPGGVVVDCDTCMPFSTLVLTLGGTAFNIKQFSLSINNQFPPNQQENNIYRTVFEPGMLQVGLTVQAGFRANTKAMYSRAIAGVAGSVAFGNGTNTYTATFGNVKIPGDGPTVPEDGEVTMGLNMMAYRSGSDPVISIAKA